MWFMQLKLLFLFNSIIDLLCISTSERMLAHAFACFRMVKNYQKHWKMMKKVLVFLHAPYMSLS